MTGPIASGKSTLARAVAAALDGVAIDLDLVYELFDGGVKDDPAVLRLARTTARLLATCLLEDGVPLVVVEGNLGDDVRADVVVSLETPLPVAVERAQADETRGLSRDPRFLGAHYDAWRPARHADLRIDTSRCTVDDAVAAVEALRPVRSLGSASLWRRAR